MTRYGANVRNTREWLAAHNRFSELQGKAWFTILGGTNTNAMLSPDESDRVMEEIVTVCPEYFPVWFHRGISMLKMGKTAEGERFMDRGFDLMAAVIEDEEEFGDLLSGTVETLEGLLRYDLAARYLERAVRLFPDTASFYDDLAYSLLQPPREDNAGALRMQEKALELDPDNDIFINNLGWIYLVTGDFKKADIYFQKAAAFNIDNEAVFENMDILEYMAKHRLSYFEYLVRPVDNRALHDLMAEGGAAEVSALCRDYNDDRLAAFKIHHLRKKTLSPHEILAALELLDIFMAALEDAANAAKEDMFLYEKTDLFQRYSRVIFRDLVVGHEIMNREFLEDIGNSAKVFYEFLRDVKLVTPDQFKRFTDQLKLLIPEFSQKAGEYSRLCEDRTQTEEELEKAAQRLFGG